MTGKSLKSRLRRVISFSLFLLFYFSILSSPSKSKASELFAKHINDNLIKFIEEEQTKLQDKLKKEISYVKYTQLFLKLSLNNDSDKEIARYYKIKVAGAIQGMIDRSMFEPVSFIYIIDDPKIQEALEYKRVYTKEEGVKLQRYMDNYTSQLCEESNKYYQKYVTDRKHYISEIKKIAKDSIYYKLAIFPPTSAEPPLSCKFILHNSNASNQ